MLQDPIEPLFDQKRKQLQSKSGDCFCPKGRNNWIHYNECPGGVGFNHGAGIKDRQNILRNLMWYADELCAKISLVCTPEVWLSEAHGCFAPKEAKWDAYFTPVRKLKNNTVSKVDILHWDVDTIATFKGIKHDIIQQPSIEAYELGRKVYAEGTTFVWHFNSTFWNTNLYTPRNIWPHQKLSHRKYTDTCGVIDMDTSEELLNIGQLMLEELGIKYSHEFVTLHLRRGDYMECDTNPWAVIKYLNCSLGDDDVKKVVVLTNGEGSYTKKLSKKFAEAFPEKEMIILDQLVESDSFVETLNEQNLLSAHVGDKFLKDNCFRFSAEKVVVSMARYHLERGHSHCESCDRAGSFNAGGMALI